MKTTLPCMRRFATYTQGGESAVLSEHQASRIFGGDCSCDLDYEYAHADAAAGGVASLYRFYRREYRLPADSALMYARRYADVPSEPMPDVAFVCPRVDRPPDDSDFEFIPF